MLIIKSLFAVSFLIQLSVLAAPIPLNARAPSLNDAIFTRSKDEGSSKGYRVIPNPPNVQSSTAGKPLASLERTWSMTDHFIDHHHQVHMNKVAWGLLFKVNH